MMGKKKRQNFMKRALLLLALVFCVVFVNEKEVSAASYKEISFSDYTGKSVVKNGKYYFKNISGHIYVSQSKNGKYVKTPIRDTFYGNGKQVYYIDRTGKVLYQYNLKTKKAKKIKRIVSASKELYVSISAVRGSKLYLSCGGEATWRYDTYIYSTSKKKVIKKIKDCSIVAIKGNYAVSEPAYRTDVSGSPLILYKFTSSGLKKIKKLSDYGWGCKFIGNKLYYTNYPVKKEMSDYTYYLMNKVELYRCSANGKGSKKIATFTSKDEYDQIIVLEITSTYCTYWCSNGTYKYTYKTKKAKKIS